MRHKGKVNPVPQGLVVAGPIVSVTLFPPKPVAEAIQNAGAEVPSIPVNLMIDTGAQKTVIEDTIMRALRINPIRFDPIVGVSQVPEDCPVYRASIAIGYEDRSGKKTVAVFEAEIVGMKSPPVPMSHVGLLGRDFLRFVRFVYDGPAGCFEINDGSTSIPPMCLAEASPADVERRLQRKKEARRLEKRRKSKILKKK